jgi:hypothetical protein
MTYLADQRAQDPTFQLDVSWVRRALADPANELKRLPPKVARSHKKALSEMLGVALPAPADARRAAPAEAQAYRAEPDVFEEHRASAEVWFAGDEDGALRLRWPAFDATSVGYRVFVGNAGTVPLLYEGRELDTVHQTGAVDTAPFAAGLRHYAVWAYSGRTEAEASASKPILWARGVAVKPVQDVEIFVTGGDVSGTWTSADGIDRVEVYRLSIPHDIPSETIPHDHLASGGAALDNLAGFHDRNVSAGEYEYRIYSCALVDGVPRRSAPVVRRQLVTVPVPLVDDLEVDVDRENSTLSLSWTKPDNPVCQVSIHWRSEEAPAGIVGRDLDDDALTRNGFTRSSRISKVPEEVDGRAHFTIGWPEGKDRLHFTPVSRVGALNKVGVPVVRTRAGAVVEAAIIERVDNQFLRFVWPSGADFVSVRQAHAGAEDTDVLTWPEIAGVYPSNHHRDGGLRLSPLPARGCTLALIGKAYHGNQETQGEPRIVKYPGLTRIDYRFNETMVTKGRFKKTEVSAGWELQVRSNAQVVDLPFVLVRQNDRLPLHSYDGERVRDFKITAGTNEVQSALIALRPGVELIGYVRVFVDVPDADQMRYAVLDPAVEQLWWGQQ